VRVNLLGGSLGVNHAGGTSRVGTMGGVTRGVRDRGAAGAVDRAGGWDCGRVDRSCGAGGRVVNAGRSRGRAGSVD
jgi:hypothetical protein